jgi:hypothetical protein
MKYNGHFNPFPYLICACYASLIIIVLASCFTPEPVAEGQVSIPHDEVVITFIAE